MLFKDLCVQPSCSVAILLLVHPLPRSMINCGNRRSIGCYSWISKEVALLIAYVVPAGVHHSVNHRENVLGYPYLSVHYACPSCCFCSSLLPPPLTGILFNSSMAARIVSYALEVLSPNTLSEMLHTALNVVCPILRVLPPCSLF